MFYACPIYDQFDNLALQTLLPSSRNQDADTILLMKQTRCTKFFCSAEMTSKVDALKSAKPDLGIFSIPSYEELISGPERPYMYAETWDNAKKDPIIALQTSGTTGNQTRVAYLTSS